MPEPDQITEVVYDRYTPANQPHIDKGYPLWPQVFLYRGVIDYPSELDTATDQAALDLRIVERLFARHNRDDRPDGRLGPSMSVNDHVALHRRGEATRWFRCTSDGFEQIPTPARTSLILTPWTHLR